MKTSQKEQLETLETEVNEELYKMAISENSLHDPITDGVVDIDRYLSSSPKMLWILKEPWEKPDEGKRGGRWSVTQNLIPDLISEKRLSSIPTYRKMAYITFSVLNNFVDYSDIPHERNDARVGESLKSIAYINISKFPGKTRSIASNIESFYRRNQHILKKQVTTINPDVVITGNILPLFYEDFDLDAKELKHAKSVDIFHRSGRLYVNAYHPSYWRCREETYVNDLVAVIKKHCAERLKR